jgi:hypothetical protein
MATDKKHIAVYLAPEVEQALIAFCQERGLVSKKGTMYSAGVNAARAQFFGIADTEASNTPPARSNTPSNSSNIPSSQLSTIPKNTGNILSNIRAEAFVVEVMPGK